MRVYIVIAMFDQIGGQELEAMAAFRSEKGANKYIADQQKIIKNGNFKVHEMLVMP